jgi:hypothetical protein
MGEEEEFRSVIAAQQKEIAALTLQMQQVSEQVAASKAKPKLVVDN